MAVHFTGARFDDGRVRVDLFEDRDAAAMNYHVMRTIGGPRRIVLGAGRTGDDAETVERKVRNLLSRPVDGTKRVG